MKKSPKVFICYSHDSSEHKQWVAGLAMKLEKQKVKVILDQWHLLPGQDIPTFIEKHLSSCNYALLICTEKYVNKANNGKGGVGYEKMIVSKEMLKDIGTRKFIPIIKQRGTQKVPTCVSSKLFVDFSNKENFDAEFNKLLRALFGEPIKTKPSIKKSSLNEARFVRNNKNILGLPNHAYAIFLKMIRGLDTDVQLEWSIEDFIELNVAGRIGVDEAVRLLRRLCYITVNENGYFVVSSLGRRIAYDNKLVRL